MSSINDSVTQNLLPVQAYFNLDGSFNTFIGQNMPFYATTNPVQSGLTITNSTIDSTTIGATTPSTGVFTNITTTTGQITTQPSGATDIVNLLALQSYAAGISWKQPVACATTANITLSGLQTIDTYTTLSGDRVIVKNQSTSANNGIYIASSGAWTRSTDADTWNELVSAIAFIEYGSQAGGAWFCTVTPGGTLGVTPVTWAQFTTSATYSAGTGLSLTGYTFSITNTGTAGTYGSASAVPVFVTNAQGQVTSVTNTSIAIANTQVSGLGTMSTQNANNVAITGGSINGTTIGASTASTVTGTTITANSSFSGPGTGLTGTATSLSIGGSAGSATTAGSVTNSVTFNNGGTGAASGTTFNGSVAQTISYNTIGAPSTTGTGASGTWGINVTGNAATVTNGVYTTGSYSNPTWITSILGSIVSGAVASATTSTNLSGGLAGSLPYQSGAGATTFLGIGSANYVLTSTGSAPQYVAQSTLSVGSASTATTATNLAGGIASQIPYQTAAGTTAFIANGTTGQFLQSNGTGAPTWSTATTAITITDDTSSATAYYPLFARVTTGTTNTEYTSSTKLNYTPSTGLLAATSFSGSGASLTSLTAGNLSGTIPSGVLGNSTVYIGTTAVALNRASASISLTGTNIDGSAGSATTATTATNSTNTAITDNTSSSSTWYPTIVSNTSGNLPQTTSSTKLSFVPSTGNLTSTVLTSTNDASISGLTVGKGAESVSTNTALGNGALGSSNTGNFNAVVGYQAAYGSTGGSSLSVLGYQAGYTNTSADHCVYVGTQAGYSNSTGRFNTFVGDSAGYTNTGGYNAFIGMNAGYSNTSGAYNTALGMSSLFSNTTASNNTAVGYQAGYSGTTGADNVHLGYKAGYSRTTGAGNCIIGDSAGYSLTTGNANTFVGAGQYSNNGCGYYVTTGTNNTILGAYDGNTGGLDIRTANGYIVLSDGNGNPRGIFDGSGNFLVGTTSSDVIGSGANGLSYRASIGNLSVLAASASALAVGRATTTGAMVYFYYNAVAKGSISTDGSNVAYNTSSDYRLKENIIDLPNALTIISQLKPRQFDWKETKETTTGFIAHELSEVMPQAVTGKKDAVDAEGNPEYQGIDTSFLVATLTAAIQELKAEFDAYKATHP